MSDPFESAATRDQVKAIGKAIATTLKDLDANLHFVCLLLRPVTEGTAVSIAASISEPDLGNVIRYTGRTLGTDDDVERTPFEAFSGREDRKSVV